MLTSSRSLEDQSFGCRVLVGEYSDDQGIIYRGKAQISEVQFKHCGQYGWNEYYDPRWLSWLFIIVKNYTITLYTDNLSNQVKFIHFCRYSLAFLNVGSIEGNETFVSGCSFHDGFNRFVSLNTMQHYI